MNEKKKGDEVKVRTPQVSLRTELDGVLAGLPGDYTDADYVVDGLRQHFGAVFTAGDEATVRELVKVPAPAPTPAAAAPVADAGVIVPTPGRVVWFWREGIDRKTCQPEAALVAFVHGESMVNLLVIEHNGVTRSEVEVSLRQPRDPEWSGRHAEWMPFQKGQAAKLEAASK